MFVVTRYAAIAQVWKPSLLDCITVPVLTLKRGLSGQSRQRCVMDLCVMLHWTLQDPHSGQCGPFGQTIFSIHLRAVSSSGNILNSLVSERPLRCDLPGALCAICRPPVGSQSMALSGKNQDALGTLVYNPLPFRDAVLYCPPSEARAPVRAFVFPEGIG